MVAPEVEAISWTFVFAETIATIAFTGLTNRPNGLELVPNFSLPKISNGSILVDFPKRESWAEENTGTYLAVGINVHGSVSRSAHSSAQEFLQYLSWLAEHHTFVH